MSSTASLHGHGAGLRRCSERVVLFHLATRKASTFQPAGGGLWARRGAAVAPEGVRVSGHRATRCSSRDPQPRQRHCRGQARREPAIAAGRLLRAAQCQLDVGPRSGRERHARWPSTTVDGSSWLAPARNAGCGSWIAMRSAARITARRFTPRRSLCNDDQASMPKACGEPWRPGRMRAGVQWILVPFWGPVSRTFHAPIEYGSPRWAGRGATSWSRRQDDGS